MAEVVYTRKETALAVRDAAAYLFFKYRFSITFELGLKAWGRRRADIVANKISGKIVIVEVKSSVADYQVDKKWHEYLEFCDQFYLAFTEKVFKKIGRENIPKKVGVIILEADSGFARITKPASTLGLSEEERVKILARLAWRKGDLSKRTQRSRKRIFIAKVRAPKTRGKTVK